MVIIRQPDAFSRRKYDLIVVGGGIYGVMLTLEATFRGLRPLLLERDDFGSATSFNSLRIVHGGLRYLQTLDLKRYFESVRDRRWLLTNFPDLVSPLPCLMPLYGRGIRRKSVFRAALHVNDLLSMNRNSGVPERKRLPGGRILGKSETIAAFPDIVQEGLRGAAVWHDAAMPDSQRVVMELLRWAAQNGADIANYMQVVAISTKVNKVRGVVARDTESGLDASFHAPVVVNAAGPWVAELTRSAGAKADNLFWPSLAWNILTDQPALSDYALAVTPPRPGAPTYFLNPWKGRLFIGTGHKHWNGSLDAPAPSDQQNQEMIDDINSSVPKLALTTKNIDRVFSGLLPAIEPGNKRLAARPVVLDHSKSGGPDGLISISGVKFTTARQVVAKTLDSVFGDRRVATDDARYRRPEAAQDWKCGNTNSSKSEATDLFLKGISRIISEESAMNLRDVVFRRTDLWEQREMALRLAPGISDCFSWAEDRKIIEIAKLADELANRGPHS